jgi:hypothetical protein
VFSSIVLPSFFPLSSLVLPSFFPRSPLVLPIFFPSSLFFLLGLPSSLVLPSFFPCSSLPSLFFPPFSIPFSRPQGVVGFSKGMVRGTGRLVTGVFFDGIFGGMAKLSSNFGGALAFLSVNKEFQNNRKIEKQKAENQVL